MRTMIAASAAMLATAPVVSAVIVSPEEMAEAHAFATASFVAPTVEPAAPGLVVLANNDPVQPNARGGKPLLIAGAEHTRGLFCHAMSKVVVTLPGPGRTFSALVGLDSNEQTRPGRGSVAFTVTVAGKEAFRSGVMREGMAEAPVEVPLGGATTFTLEVDDAGDGIACDQADWAEAKAVLNDGTEVWLADLPLTQQSAAPHAGPPFSFVYDGKPSAELLPQWKVQRDTKQLDGQRTQHTVSYTDPGTGLEVRAVAVEYLDFPTVEWTLHFRNGGAADTPILESILPLDTGYQGGPTGTFLLHHNVGSPANQTDFGPLLTPLGSRATKRISAAGGRPTNTDMSYFNLEWPGEQRLIAVGWPGQWAAEFTRDATVGIRVRAGQEVTHFRLLPGEEVRTPLMVVQFSEGSASIRAQNVWRRWMMAHSMPKPGGELPRPAFRASSSRAYEEMKGANEENQIMHIDRYLEEGLKLDCWWMDAGWYVQEHGWPQVGTWEIDPKRFPRGFKPISEHAHARAVKILVWFEPERVAAGTWLADKHPEWVLGGAGGGLLNLGDPAAWGWLVNHIDTLITEQGIDVYRQDFNMDPLDFWRRNDTPDRQGITEIKHVTGLLAYWDELLRRHPDLLIDTCASGGRRVDLETLRRAVPLWRSDYAFEPVGHQGMTYGLSMWVPYHGTGTVADAGAPYYGGGVTKVDPYAFWSNAAPSLGSGIDLREKAIDYAALRRLLEEWRRISPCYYGDFYPLTPYSLDTSQWIAWQFDCPERGEGVVQAFRRSESIYEAARLKLRELDPDATYEVRDIDSEAVAEVSGRDLMEKGLPIALPTQPSAAVVTYKLVGR
jgi:alpha-galactosidase